MQSKKILTLAIVHKEPHVLLGYKKRGFGAGRWNGFGGKVEAGETVEEAAVRELHEEAGIRAVSLKRCGALEFSFEGEEEILDVSVFKVVDFKHEPAESDEMRPEWFHKDEIPFDSMWPDDRHWFPFFLEGKKFRGAFLFKDHDTIVYSKVFEADR